MARNEAIYIKKNGKIITVSKDYRDKDIKVSTFREEDIKGNAPRALYKKFGFI